jgi:hypothetical protein
MSGWVDGKKVFFLPPGRGPSAGRRRAIEMRCALRTATPSTLVLPCQSYKSNSCTSHIRANLQDVFLRCCRVLSRAPTLPRSTAGDEFVKLITKLTEFEVEIAPAKAEALITKLGLKR